MYAYAKAVWVDAGTYPLEIKILPCEDPSWTEVAKYFVDYITLQPTADEVTKDSENNYTAKVCFSSPVSGVALMAAYNGNELAAVSSTLLSEATQYVETTLNTDKSVTHVKVFVWDGTENCIPQAACKELLVSE